MAEINFHNFEKIIFKIVVLLSALPILIFEFYPTMDGAAHLYNSNLIWSLLFDNHENIHQFFVLNNEPVPNWTGHFLLGIFNSLLPAYIADSLVLLICVMGLPLAFRRLMQKIEPNSILISYLIFPFVYSFTFTLGFYNFSIALVCLFFTLSYWLQIKDKAFSWKVTLILFLLVSVTYFSHLFVFGILLLTIGLNIVHGLVSQLVSNEVKFKVAIKKSISQLLILLSASFITLILSAQYFLNRPSSKGSSWLSQQELLEDLMIIGPIISYNSQIEEAWTTTLFYLLVLALVVGLFIKVNALRKKMVDKSNDTENFLLKSVVQNSFWPLVTLVLLLLYFSLPDSDGYAGYISTRIALLFFMFFILWLSTTRFHKWFMIGVASLSIFLTVKFVLYYSEAVKPLNEIAINCTEASRKVPANSVVLPINLSNHWLLPHFSNYLGAEKPVVILENYEASTGYFPVKWNEKTAPATLLGNRSVDDLECLYWKSGDSTPAVSADFVFMLGGFDGENECHNEIKTALDSHYKEVYKKGRVSLFEMK